MTNKPKTRERKFNDSDKVVTHKNVNLGPYMIVVSAEELVVGWRYQLAFPTKKGLPHKTRHHRFVMEDNLTPYNHA